MQKNKSIQLNAILNIIKQCCVIIFPLITYSYVTRVLGSANYGRFSFSQSIIELFVSLASLGIPTYAIRETARVRDDNKKVENISSQLLTINVIMLVFTLIVLFLLVRMVPRLHRESVLIAILSMEIISNIFGRDWVNNVFEDFFYLTIRYIVIQTISLILILTLIKTSNDFIKYTWIMAISYSANYLLNIYYTRRYIPYKLTIHLNLKKHLKPIIYLFCIQIATTIFVKSDIIILGFFRPDSEVGIYTIASNIYVVIKTLLNAVIVVAIPRLSVYLGKEDRESYMRLLSGLRNVLYTLVIPSVIGILFLSKDIMTILGGNAFVSGFSSLSILCVAIFFAVFGCFYSQAILVPNRDERSYFFATVLSALVNVGLNFVLIPIWGINAAAFTTVLAEATIVLVCRKYSQEYIDKFTVMKISPIVLGCVAIALNCILCQKNMHWIVFRVSGSILISSFLYVIILILGKNEVVLNGLEMIRKKLNL